MSNNEKQSAGTEASPPPYHSPAAVMQPTEFGMQQQQHMAMGQYAQPMMQQPQHMMQQSQHMMQQPQHMMQQPQPMMHQPQHMIQQTGFTTVVLQQQQQQMKTMRDWRSGVCGCFDDCGICLLTQFCPLCAACQLSIDMGESPCVPLVPCFLLPLRAKLRTQLNISGGVCNDCVTVCCLPACAMCQMQREVKVARANGELM